MTAAPIIIAMAKQSPTHQMHEWVTNKFIELKTYVNTVNKPKYTLFIISLIRSLKMRHFKLINWWQRLFFRQVIKFQGCTKHKKCTQGRQCETVYSDFIDTCRDLLMVINQQSPPVIPYYWALYVNS